MQRRFRESGSGHERIQHGLPFRMPANVTDAMMGNSMLDINVDKSMIDMVFGKIVAFAKMNNRRKIIACASSIGPGAANMITAAATATVNNVPLLLFPADTFSTRQPYPVLQP